MDKQRGGSVLSLSCTLAYASLRASRTANGEVAVDGKRDHHMEPWRAQGDDVELHSMSVGRGRNRGAIDV